MAVATFSNALLPLAGTDGTDADEPVRRGIMARLIDAITASRQRMVMRDLARLQRVHGVRLTDAPLLSLRVERDDLPFGS